MQVDLRSGALSWRVPLKINKRKPNCKVVELGAILASLQRHAECPEKIILFTIVAVKLNFPNRILLQYC